MEITELSKLNPKKLFCLIRKKWVTALPEEIVRQKVVEHMTLELGYPIGGIGLEQNLSKMPWLALDCSKIPNRRIDLIFFYKDPTSGTLAPLLLIECKAVPLTEKVVRQVLGYNLHLNASFVGIINAEETKVFWKEAKESSPVCHHELPSYQKLLEIKNSLSML